MNRRKIKIFYPKPTLKWVFHFKLTKKMQLRPLSPLTRVANATFSFVPYMQTINLVTTFDLVTLFGLTKSVTKSEVDCILGLLVLWGIKAQAVKSRQISKVTRTTQAHQRDMFRESNEGLGRPPLFLTKKIHNEHVTVIKTSKDRFRCNWLLFNSF